jgi:hypothetical protein
MGKLDLKGLIDERLRQENPRPSPFSTSMDKGIDVSGIPDTPGKVKRILVEFDNAIGDGYYRNNKLVNQIVELVEDAIRPLLDEYQQSRGDESQWAKQHAIFESLDKLMAEAHKELILDEFKRSGILI